MCSMSTGRNKGRISLAKETFPTFFIKTSNTTSLLLPNSLARQSLLMLRGDRRIPDGSPGSDAAFLGRVCGNRCIKPWVQNLTQWHDTGELLSNNLKEQT